MLAAFHPIDWAIVICYIACMLGVGFYVRPFISNVGHYIVAGRAVRFALAVSTMIGTELGLVTLAYMSQVGFTGGLAGFHVPLIHMSVALVIGFTGFIIYRLRKAGVMTIPEYYRQRYGPRTRLVGGIILVLAGVLNMGMFLKAGATVIGGLTGLTRDVEINLIMTALLGIVLAYTIMGGMVSVVVTDFLQFIFVGSSLLIVTLFCFQRVDWDFGKVVSLVAGYSTRQGDEKARAEMIATAAGLEQTEAKINSAPAAARKADQAIQTLMAEAERSRPQEDEALKAFAAAARTLHEAQKALEEAKQQSGQQDSPDAAKAQAEVQAARQRLEPLSERLRTVAAASKALEAKLIEARKELSSARAEAEQAREGLADAKERFEEASKVYAPGDAGRKSAEAAFNPLHKKGFGGLYVLWMVLVALTGYTLWQPATMRALMARSPSVAKRAYVASSLGFLVRFMIPMFWGICAFIFIMEQPDLKEMFFPAVGAGADTLKATPIFLARILPVGVSGFVMAGLLASFMSTHDSYLMAWSSSIVQDVIAPIASDRLSSRARVLLTRLFVFLIGLFLLLWGLWFPMEGRLWDYLAITGTIYSAGAIAVVGGGLYWKRASSAGAVIALCAGLLAILGILPWRRLGRQWNVNLEFMSNENIAIVAFGLAVVGMIVGSLLLPDRKRKEVQP